MLTLGLLQNPLTRVLNHLLSAVGKASTMDPGMDTGTPATGLVSLLGAHLAASLTHQHLVFCSRWANA